MDTQEIQKVIGAFEEFYYSEQVHCRCNHEDPSEISFRGFMQKPEYASLFGKIEKAAQESGSSLEELVFSNLDEKQKSRIGALFYRGQGEVSDDAGFFLFSKKADIVERAILNTPEYVGYLALKDYILDDKERKRFADKIARKLYDRLSSEQKKLLEEKTIRKYLLNLGFIKSKRPDHKAAITFMKEYPALFENETSVLFHVLERYVDEELTDTPIEETKEKIRFLKEEAQEIWRGIKNGH